MRADANAGSPSTTTRRSRRTPRPAPARHSPAAHLRATRWHRGTRRRSCGLPAAIAQPRPAILFLHWYGPPSPTSNRTQFLPEAVELAGVRRRVAARRHAVDAANAGSGQRDSAKDYEFTVQMAKDVRRALDVLLAQPGLDQTRIAVVGHDFGAMWGALAVASDPRVTHFAYAAGTRSFTDWYLYTPKREGAERDAFVAKLAPLDPITFLPKIAPRPVLLQFGSKDPHVKNEAATAQADATREPKTVKTYEGAEHELTFQARLDRLAWLAGAVQAAEVRPGSTDAIAPVTSACRSGFEIYPSIPASRKRSLSPCMACAVTATIGRCAPERRSRSRIAAVASSPSMTGICTSMKTRSKVSIDAQVGGFPAVGDDRDDVAEFVEHQLQHSLIHRDIVRDQDLETPWSAASVAGAIGPARRRAIGIGRRRRLEPDGEMERAAAPLRALDPDAAAHQLHEALRDGEAETRAAVASGRRAVGLGELLENQRLLGGGDADARVANPNVQRRPAAVTSVVSTDDRHLAALR